MKDNFTNPKYHKYLKNNQGSSYSDNLKNYTGLVNQPTSNDAFADVFTEQAKGISSEGAMNQAAKGALASFGAGVRGAENDRRRDEMSPFLKQAAMITAKAAEIEAQTQEEELRVSTGVNLMKSNISLLTAFGSSTTAGAVEEATGQAKLFGEKYQQAFGVDLGEFDSYDLDKRRIYYKDRETGAIMGYDLADELREYAEAAYGEQAPLIMKSFDPYYKEQYENTRAMQQMQMQGLGLDNQLKSAQANAHNANAESTRHEISPRYQQQQLDDKRNTLNQEVQIKENRVAAEKWYESRDKYQKQNQAAQNLFNLTKSEEFGGTGFKRGLAQLRGENPDTVKANYYALPLATQLKDTFGNILAEEAHTYLPALPNISQNPEGLREVLQDIIAVNNNKIQTYTKRLKEYDKNPAFNAYKIEDEEHNPYNTTPTQPSNSGQEGVIVKDLDTGEQQKIPTNMLEEAKRRGLVVVE